LKDFEAAVPPKGLAGVLVVGDVVRVRDRLAAAGSIHRDVASEEITPADLEADLQVRLSGERER
jgi:hypothetical protein